MEVWSFRALRANLAAWLLAIPLLGIAPVGGAYVTTLPSGADVWLDGTYLGRSPLVLDSLPAGPHRLAITRTGWFSQDLTMTVIAHQTTPESVVLERGPGAASSGGMLVVHGDASVLTIDGAPPKPPVSGAYRLTAGMHDIALANAHGRTVQSITVYPDMRTDLVMRDEAAAARSSVISPVDDYLPASAYRVDAGKVLLRYAGHDVVGRLGANDVRLDGRTIAYDSAPTMIGSRLYLPLELLTLLTAGDKK